VLLDPPYEDLQLSLLQKLVNRHVKKGGILACCRIPGKITYPPDLKWVTASCLAKDYGDSQLVFYRKIK
jgi:16S rRNA G966 N2-methylase RsmD